MIAYPSLSFARFVNHWEHPGLWPAGRIVIPLIQAWQE